MTVMVPTFPDGPSSGNVIHCIDSCSTLDREYVHSPIKSDDMVRKAGKGQMPRERQGERDREREGERDRQRDGRIESARGRSW